MDRPDTVNDKATPPTPPPTPVTRRELLRRGAVRTLSSTLGAGALASVYAAGIEPFRPVLTRADLPVANLPPALDGFRIAHLSDFHVRGSVFPAARLRPAVDMANRERPDLIALTGDYVNDFAGDPATRTIDMNDAARELGRLRARFGVFAIFGNHDFMAPPGDNPDRVPWLRAGITPLLDEAMTIPIGAGARLVLVGLRSSLVRPVVPELFFPQVPQGDDVFRLLLWHEPDRAEESARAGANAQLSGHTHGGQVVLPGVGPLVLPPQGKRYASGRFNVGGMPLFVTRGIGMLPPRVRFCCPPEIALLTLRRR